MEPNQQDMPPETPAESPSAGDSGDSSGKKRKAPHEYSTNPNTVRVRQRNAKLTPYRLAVERARSNDLKAVSTAWKERGETETFHAASESAKKKILEEVEKEVMDRRRRKKIDADSKIAALNLTLGPDEENLPAPPHSGLVTNNTSNPLPLMAPPGYVPFPTQPIAHLMEVPKKGDLPAVGVTASTSSTIRAEDGAGQPAPGLQAGSTTSHLHAEITAAIEDLKKMHEAETRRYEDEKMQQMAEIQQLRGAIEDMRYQLQHVVALLQSIQPHQPAHAPTFPHAPVHPHEPVYTHAPTHMYPPLPPIQAPTHQTAQHSDYRHATKNVDDLGYTGDNLDRWFRE